jgi:flavin reductase ActVB
MAESPTSPVAARHRATMQQGLREAMSRVAGAVVVVTTTVAGRPWGVTVSSCCPLSMDPPLLLVCLANKAVSTKAIMEQSCFGLNILAADQIEIARRTSAVGVPKFIDDIVREEIEMGTPLINGSLAAVHCELYNALVVGDHTILIGHVDAVEVGTFREPLLYFRREFCQPADGPIAPPLEPPSG